MPCRPGCHHSRAPRRIWALAGAPMADSTASASALASNTSTGARAPWGRAARMADQKTRRPAVLLGRLAAVEGMADLEQRQVHHAARLVARRGLQQAGQQRGAHVAHLRRDRVFQPRRIVAAAEELRRRLVDEAVGHAFVVAERGHGPPRARSRSWPGVRTGAGTPGLGRRIGFGSSLVSEAMRATSSTRSASPCTSRRQDGTQTSSTSPVRWPEAQRGQDAHLLVAGISMPTRRCTRRCRAGRRARCHRAPAPRHSDASPPHSSRIICASRPPAPATCSPGRRRARCGSARRN
jgi:hypothetical protein